MHKTIVLPDNMQTKGTAICFQIRTLDLNVRDAGFIEKAPEDFVNACARLIAKMIS